LIVNISKRKGAPRDAFSAWESRSRRRCGSTSLPQASQPMTSMAAATFHALRHTFGTAPSRAGVTPRTAMELMRHSDIRLTTKT
jgi:integrase